MVDISIVIGLCKQLKWMVADYELQYHKDGIYDNFYVPIWKYLPNIATVHSVASYLS